MGISFILHMQMRLIKAAKALPFAPVWRSSPAGNLLRERRDVAMGDGANGQRRTAVITIFSRDSQTEGQRKVTQACH